MSDQAQKLREQVSRHPVQTRKTRVVTVTSGKGGVGKSNFALNFALCLIEQGQKVVILDADIGLANIDVLLGICPKHNLLYMVEERRSVWEIMEKGPNGLELIPGSSGLAKLGMLDDQQLGYLFEQLNLLEGHADLVIIDTGAGLSKEALKFLLASDEVIVVTTPEPTSLTDAYAIIKILHTHNPLIRPMLVVNRVTSDVEGKITADRLSLVAKQFLGFEIRRLGHIYEDQNVSRSVKRQEPVVLAYPNSPASQSFRNLAQRYLDPMKNHQEPPKGIKGFLQKMLNFIR